MIGPRNQHLLLNRVELDKYIAFCHARQADFAEPAIIPTKRLSETSKLPTYGSDGAAGMDLYADLGFKDSNLVILVGERKMIPTNIAMAIPPTHYGKIEARSGLSYKSGTVKLAGVIDEDYRGAIGVILLNTGSSPLVIKHHDRIAQMIIHRYAPAHLIEVDDLDTSTRGSNGFGSTGMQ